MTAKIEPRLGILAGAKNIQKIQEIIINEKLSPTHR
jgi:hypothetical protein